MSLEEEYQRERKRAEEYLENSALRSMAWQEAVIENTLISVNLLYEDFLEFLANGEILKKLNLFGMHSYLCMLKMIHIENKSINLKRDTIKTVKILCD